MKSLTVFAELPEAFRSWNCVLEGALVAGIVAVAVMFSSAEPPTADYIGRPIVPLTVAGYVAGDGVL
jgi:hypothetical protein